MQHCMQPLMHDNEDAHNEKYPEIEFIEELVERKTDQRNACPVKEQSKDDAERKSNLDNIGIAFGPLKATPTIGLWLKIVARFGIAY